MASSLEDVRGRRIATSYDGLVRAHLAERGIEAEVVRLDGAVESSVQLGVADVIADVVSTGATLRGAGLEVFGDPILTSEAVLVRRRRSAGSDAVEVLVRRLQGVLVARQYVMMDYDVRVELVEQACAVTPGLESPTVSPLHDKGWVAVRSMVPRATHQPGDGRALQPRRARHPRHHHPRLPDLMSDATNRSAAGDLAVFAPHRTRRVALGLAAGVTVLVVALAVLVPSDFRWPDRLGFLVVGALIDGFLWRQATVRAVPTEQGLHVRNLFLSRELEWAQVVSVRFGDRPWVQLDLDDGDTLAVMGVQRSDGERAQAEARRLAGLVERFSTQR